MKNGTLSDNGTSAVNGDLKAHAAQFAKLADSAKRLRDQSQYFAVLLKEHGIGKYETATVYAVRGHRVRAHWRHDHVAVRAVRRKK